MASHSFPRIAPLVLPYPPLALMVDGVLSIVCVSWFRWVHATFSAFGGVLGDTSWFVCCNGICFVHGPSVLWFLMGSMWMQADRPATPDHTPADHWSFLSLEMFPTCYRLFVQCFLLRTHELRVKALFLWQGYGV